MNKNKIIRLQPSPYVSTSIQLKMAQPKTNSSGYAVTDSQGRILQSEVSVNDAVQVPGTSKTISPVLTSSGLKTGLEKIVENPYKDLDGYSPSWGEKIFKGKDKVSLQHILEYKHGREYNYYSNRYMDTIVKSTELHEKPFFLTDKCKLRLDGNVVFLNLNNPLDEVRYYMILIHPFVANSYKDLDDGKNRKAGYYIVDEEEVMDLKLEKVKRQTKSAAALEELNEKEDSIIVNMAYALGIEERNPIKTLCYKYIHSYYNKSEENYAIFMKFFDMYKDSGRRDRFFANGLVQELLNYNVLRSRDSKLYWVMPETDDKPMRTFEWSSKDKFISEFILAPEYQEEFEIMKSILESRK